MIAHLVPDPTATSTQGSAETSTPWFPDKDDNDRALRGLAVGEPRATLQYDHFRVMNGGSQADRLQATHLGTHQKSFQKAFHAPGPTTKHAATGSGASLIRPLSASPQLSIEYKRPGVSAHAGEAYELYSPVGPRHIGTFPIWGNMQ